VCLLSPVSCNPRGPLVHLCVDRGTLRILRLLRSSVLAKCTRKFVNGERLVLNSSLYERHWNNDRLVFCRLAASSIRWKRGLKAILVCTVVTDVAVGKSRCLSRNASHLIPTSVWFLFASPLHGYRVQCEEISQRAFLAPRRITFVWRLNFQGSTTSVNDRRA
jgi:hypothetical protein